MLLQKKHSQKKKQTGHSVSKSKSSPCRRTYQSDPQKEDLENPTNGGGADNVSIAHSGHGDHQEVDTFPVAQLMHIAEVGGIA